MIRFVGSPSRYVNHFLIICAFAISASGLIIASAAAYDNGSVPVNTVKSARRVITDLIENYAERYPNGKEYLERLDVIEAKLKKNADDEQAQADLKTLIREATLANPLLDVDRILVIRRKGEANRRLNSHTSDTIKRTGWDNELSIISNLRSDVKIDSLYRHPNNSVMKHVDLHFSGERIMFSGTGKNGNWAILEIAADGTDLKELSPDDQTDVQWFDGCYLPEEGKILSCSTAGMQGLPCENGGRPMVNLYNIDTRTKDVRQLTFEQDSDWHPRALENGRVLYLRWEYTDIPHYFSRFLFNMNPDGTGQMEFWGSGSYFPTAYCHARPVPGSSSRVIGIVSGHHAKSETGRLLIVDHKLGRKYPFKYNPTDKVWGTEGDQINIHPEVLPAEETGCVQEIPGWGRDVVGNVYDNQGGNQTYTFGTPWPLSDKYFLVKMLGPESKKWGLWLVDVFDNMTLVYEDPDYDIDEPVLMKPRKTPPVLVDRTIPDQPATIFCTDVYGGRGLKGIPRGTVKKLRVLSYHYGYIGRGGHMSCGQESSWDIKRIIGTVPVEEDGSFCFLSPPNTPIAIQPLDENGQALALMRSWMVGMPGELLSCNGCHEDQNEVTPNRRTIAGTRPPREIDSWYGSARPFSFQAEVQPVLDLYCVGCHNNEKRPAGLSFISDGAGHWKRDQAYLALSAFARRPGPESDLDIYNAMEWHSSTSELIQRLRKGHKGVELDREAWERIYTWIDLNVPYRGMWDHEGLEQRRLELATLYAGLTDNPEEEYRVQIASVIQQRESIEPIIPEKIEKPGPDGLSAEGFPFDASKAKQMQDGAAPIELKLGDNLKIKLVRIPAGQFVMGSQDGLPDEQPRAVVSIDQPFWMATTETTNAQYAVFDPQHDTRYLDEHGKDHAVPGYIANHPDQPVARISWLDAMRFCEWLSEKTGKKVTLPTEAQWEWAARAGSGEQFFYGDGDTDFSSFANLADASRRRIYTKWDGGSKIHVRRDYPEDSIFPLRDDRFTDKWFVVDYVAQYEPNPLGLYDMIGNVCEWTRSDYASYPYKAEDGRNAGDEATMKVARGGSWNDRPKVTGSSRRYEYQPYQKVYNVGFRVIVEE